MLKEEKIAFDAGKTAEQRIGDKAMCYDPIMEKLIRRARTAAGCEYNKRIMVAWLRGRGWYDYFERKRDNEKPTKGREVENR